MNKKKTFLSHSLVSRVSTRAFSFSSILTGIGILISFVVVVVINLTLTSRELLPSLGVANALSYRLRPHEYRLHQFTTSNVYNKSKSQRIGLDKLSWNTLLQKRRHFLFVSNFNKLKKDISFFHPFSLTYQYKKDLVLSSEGISFTENDNVRRSLRYLPSYHLTQQSANNQKNNEVMDFFSESVDGNAPSSVSHKEKQPWTKASRSQACPQLMICSNRWCMEKGAGSTIATFTGLLQDEQTNGLRIQAVDCLNKCSKGPNMRILRSNGTFEELSKVDSVDRVHRVLTSHLGINVNTSRVECLKLNFRGNEHLERNEVDEAIECYDKAMELCYQNQQEGVIRVMRSTAYLQRAYNHFLTYRELIEKLMVPPYQATQISASQSSSSTKDSIQRNVSTQSQGKKGQEQYLSREDSVMTKSSTRVDDNGGGSDIDGTSSEGLFSPPSTSLASSSSPNHESNIFISESNSGSSDKFENDEMSIKEKDERLKLNNQRNNQKGSSSKSLVTEDFDNNEVDRELSKDESMDKDLNGSKMNNSNAPPNSYISAYDRFPSYSFSTGAQMNEKKIQTSPSETEEIPPIVNIISSTTTASFLFHFLEFLLYNPKGIILRPETYKSKGKERGKSKNIKSMNNRADSRLKAEDKQQQAGDENKGEEVNKKTTSSRLRRFNFFQKKDENVEDDQVEGKENESLLNMPFLSNSKSYTERAKSNNLFLAIPTLTRLIKVHEEYEKLYKSSKFQFGLFEYAVHKASQDALKSTQIMPTFTRSWINLGHSLRFLRKYDEAIECYKVVATIQIDRSDEMKEQIRKIEDIQRKIEKAKASNRLSEEELLLLHYSLDDTF